MWIINKTGERNKHVVHDNMGKRKLIPKYTPDQQNILAFAKEFHKKKTSLLEEGGKIAGQNRSLNWIKKVGSRKG